MATLLLLFCLSGVEDLQQHTEYLADDARQGRHPATAGMIASQEYVTRQLEAAGIKAERQVVDDCYNIIGTVEGYKPESYIVVGAHLDHIGRDYSGRVVNGADDNASGCAVLLELAKKVKKHKPIRTVVFIWFTGEEGGFIGSKKYVNTRDELPVFMLNLDMVGHLDYNTPDEKDTEPLELAHLFDKYPFAERITWRNIGGRWSDQAPFTDAGVPTLFLHTGLTNDYHTYRDDADTLDYDGMQAIFNYAYDIIVYSAGIAPEYLIRKEK